MMVLSFLQIHNERLMALFFSLSRSCWMRRHGIPTSIVTYFLTAIIAYNYYGVLLVAYMNIYRINGFRTDGRTLLYREANRQRRIRNYFMECWAIILSAWVVCVGY